MTGPSPARSARPARRPTVPDALAGTDHQRGGRCAHAGRDRLRRPVSRRRCCRHRPGPDGLHRAAPDLHPHRRGLGRPAAPPAGDARRGRRARRGGGGLRLHPADRKRGALASRGGRGRHRVSQRVLRARLERAHAAGPQGRASPARERADEPFAQRDGNHRPFDRGAAGSHGRRRLGLCRRCGDLRCQHDLAPAPSRATHVGAGAADGVRLRARGRLARGGVAALAAHRPDRIRNLERVPRPVLHPGTGHCREVAGRCHGLGPDRDGAGRRWTRGRSARAALAPGAPHRRRLLDRPALLRPALHARPAHARTPDHGLLDGRARVHGAVEHVVVHRPPAADPTTSALARLQLRLARVTDLPADRVHAGWPDLGMDRRVRNPRWRSDHRNRGESDDPAGAERSPDGLANGRPPPRTNLPQAPRGPGRSRWCRPRRAG